MVVLLLLSSQLFGECDAENDVSPDTELIPANGGEEMEIESNGKEHLSTRLWAERNEYDPIKLLEKVGVFPCGVTRCAMMVARCSSSPVTLSIC